MKKRIMKRVAWIFMFVMLMVLKSTVRAEGENLENNKHSVVQVVMTYTAKDGKRFILQSGSGVVINNNTILTNYHIVHISAKNLEKAQKYVSQNSESAELSSEDDIQVGIVKKDDVLIYGTITQESKENDFALLSLEELTDCKPAILGNSDITVLAENVIAVGYPTTDPFGKDGATLFTSSDVNLISGIVSEVNPQILKISGKISSGNSGGALLNVETGEMMGLLIYNKNDNKKECFRVLPINWLKSPYLEGTTYIDNSVATTEQEIEKEETEVQIDKTLLDECINKANKLDQAKYTSDSYLIVLSCLQQAQQIQSNEQVTQEEIDDAQMVLQRSMDNLVMAEHVDSTKMIVVIALVVAFIIIVIIAIIIVVVHLKHTRKQQIAADSQNGFDPVELEEQISRRLAATMANSKQNAEQGTTVLSAQGVLRNEDGNATTLLNTAPSQINAFLVRQRTGERKQIDSVEFTIGKDATRVNYCVNGNSAISRCHLKIIRRGNRYFVMDLGSTNYTFLNDEKVAANEEREVKNGDRIKAADEEFVLEIR